MPAPEGRNPYGARETTNTGTSIDEYLAGRERRDRAEAPGILVGDIDFLLREAWARGRRVGEQRATEEGRERAAEAFDAGWDAGAADGTEGAVAEAFDALDLLTAEVIEARKRKPAAAAKSLERIAEVVGNVYVAMPKRAEQPIEEPRS